MSNQNYTATIEVTNSPHDVFNHITDVSKWWARSSGESLSGMQSEFEGQSTQLHDEFIIRSGDRHYSKQRLMEVVLDEKIVWQVIESKLNWLEKNKNEWTATKMIFEISVEGEKTVLRFTHEGLVPDQECYERCERSWDVLIRERLFNFITKDHAL